MNHQYRKHIDGPYVLPAEVLRTSWSRLEPARVSTSRVRRANLLQVGFVYFGYNRMIMYEAYHITAYRVLSLPLSRPQKVCRPFFQRTFVDVPDAY